MNLTTVAALLTTRHNITDVIFMVDGGGAVLHAGPARPDARGDLRRPACAGPGTIGPDGDVTAQTGDLHIGPDDDGDTPELQRVVPADATEETVARMIAELVQHSPVGYRFNRHARPDGARCRWSLCSVVAPENRSEPGNRLCPDLCPTSDIEVNPFADDQRYDETLPDPADNDPTRDPIAAITAALDYGTRRLIDARGRLEFTGADGYAWILMLDAGRVLVTCVRAPGAEIGSEVHADSRRPVYLPDALADRVRAVFYLLTASQPG